MSQHATPFEHPVTRAVRAIGAALDQVAGADPMFLSVQAKREALVELGRLEDRVGALRLSVVAASGEVAEVDGMPNVASWLTPRTGTDPGPNHHDERLALALRHRWPVVAAGFAAGGVSRAQAKVVVRALEALGSDVEADLLAECEEHLVAQCAEFGPRALRRLGRKVLEVIAPERYEDEERKKLEREERRAAAQTRLVFRNRGDGTVDISIRISEAAGQRLRTYLQAYTSPRHQDSGDPAVPLRDPATGARVPHDQRMGLAFTAFLEAADPARMPVHGGTATTLVLTMGFAELKAGLGVATLGDGSTISATEARRLACNANLMPAVLDGKGQVLDLGLAQRLFSGAQRRAMSIEHPFCRAEGCEVPAAWCEAHHWKQDWSKGGRTDLRDGKLLCPWHHHRAHDPGYTLTHLPDGGVRYHKRT